jgi:hypothetical protein
MLIAVTWPVSPWLAQCELARAQASDVERGFLLVHQTKSRRVRGVPLSSELLAAVWMHVGRLVPFAEGSVTCCRLIFEATSTAG